MNEKLLKIRTLGELKSAGYQTMPVRMEMRKNLLDRLRSKEQILPGIVGYALGEPPNTAAAAAKPVAGLGVTRRRVGSLVIYEIGPGPAVLHGSD